MCKSRVALLLGIAAVFGVLTILVALWTDDVAIWLATSGSSIAILPMLLDGGKPSRCRLRRRATQVEQA